MAINPKIKQKAEDIRKKIFGVEVRESLASGIEAISEDVEATIGRQGYVEEQFQDVLDETTGKDVISAPELIAARNGKSNLKTRLDDEHAQVTAQLQQIAYSVNTDQLDITISLQSLINSAPSGSTVLIPPQAFEITNEITINKPLNIVSNGGEIIQKTAGKSVFLITSSNVTIEGLKITGLQKSVLNNDEKAIRAYGLDANNYIFDVIVKNCEISNFGYGAVILEFVDRFEVTNNHIHDVFYTGILGYSCLNGHVKENQVSNIEGAISGNSYGIVFSRMSGELSVFPRSENIYMYRNTVKNIVEWCGLNTHAGKNITFSENYVSNCYYGIAVSAGSDGAEKPFSPIDCKIINNTIFSDADDGSQEFGISFAGNTIDGGATGSIIGNRIEKYGNQNNKTGGAINILRTKNLVISGNEIIEPSPTGIYFNIDNYGFVCSNNVITDVWTDDPTVNIATCIQIHRDNNYGTVEGNTFKKGTKTALKTMDRGISTVNSLRLVAVNVGFNYNDCELYILDSNFLTFRNSKDGKIFSHHSLPTTGDFSKGDKIYNTNALSGGYIGWVCTATGTPGTWKGFGMIEV